MVIMGVDLGKARTGLAICDRAEMLAVPLCVVEEHNRERLIDKIAEKAAESKAELLVVGLPKNMDGSEGESAVSARETAALLAEKTKLPIELCDERGTTITAHNYLNETNTRGKKRKAAVDAVAATVILQNHLDKRRHNRQK
ncbi:Holliday junction resolvase RuvX [Scatolibacter rhodanostii]|uniref:Holliday junction resolvase RuvX n=1 Tax=Scatolibacter rhodanostii TaxID=2014781 RepID=UPI000C085298|nr:Holliday junction resolvase RuvX [Scatolibacter rhodanostii]